jgi:uncharacterized membrane protein YhaH (DUF805 family)
MKKYFYSKGGEKEGPVTLEELIQISIEPKTLIWHEGLDDWKLAESVEELKSLFELTPPPIVPEIDDRIIPKPTTSIRKKQRMFSNPFSFNGRIRRTEYGISFIITVILATLVNDFVKSGRFPLAGMANIPLYWFFFAQGAKRCHDYGKNGWWQIIPLYPIIMIFTIGSIEMNEYGINPKN